MSVLKGAMVNKGKIWKCWILVLSNEVEMLNGINMTKSERKMTEPSAPMSARLSNQFSSVQFSHSVVSDSLWSHGLHHARLPCPSPIPEAYANSCPSSQWCHLTISSSVIPFSSCPQSLPALIQMSQLFASGGQNIRVSASTSVLPVNTQDWSPLG